jgi:hypothetical protein
MLAFPKVKFAVLGFFDTIFNIFSTWPVPAIGGSTSNVLSQSVIPMNLGLSSAVLRMRFTRLHYAGAFLAVYGVLVRMIPSFLGDKNESGGYASGLGYIFWCGIMILSQIPAALSNVYKEVALKGAEKLDVWYSNAVISTFQLLFGVVTIPLAGLPFVPDHVDILQFFTYAADATNCFLGNVVQSTDNCKLESTSPVVIFCVYLVFNIAYNLLMLSVMQEGSSALYVVSSALRLPLVDILLLWGWLAGSAAAPFTVFDGFALVGLLLAIYLYNADPEIHSEEEPRTLGELFRTVWAGLVWMFGCCCCLPRNMGSDTCNWLRRKWFGTPGGYAVAEGESLVGTIPPSASPRFDRGARDNPFGRATDQSSPLIGATANDGGVHARGATAVRGRSEST